MTIRLGTVVWVRAMLARRAWVERIRGRLLRQVPRSWLYYLVIEATVRVVRPDEHPDSVGAMEVVRRLSQ
jgi:hypothetical protein